MPRSLGALGQPVQLLGDHVVVVDGVGETAEQTRIRSVPSSLHDVELAVGPAQVVLDPLGTVVSKSRNGWYRSIDRPRSAHRSPHLGRPTARTPRSPARRSPRRRIRPPPAAVSLSSSVPEMQTVAMAGRGRGRCDACPLPHRWRRRAADVDEHVTCIAPRGRCDPQSYRARLQFRARPASVPTSGRSGAPVATAHRRKDGDMAPELPEALREVAERAANVLAPESDLFEDSDSAGFGTR